MVSFTVEEALANLKDPLRPQFIKKDMEEEQNSTEGTNSFGGGLDASSNLANSFTDESWEEFCDRYKLRYFGTGGDRMFPHDTYVNYETCAVVEFDSKGMKILSAYWEDSKGELQYESFYEDTLEKFHEGLMHAVFPKKATELFTELVQLDHFENFFPARDGSSTLWELLQSKIECQQDDDNKEFVDRVCQLISVQIDEDAEKSSSVNVDLGEFVFRQNVKGDGSYHDDVLEVIELGRTYVKLLVHDTLESHYIYAYRGDFWHNFGVIASLESEVVAFLLDLFDNVLNGYIVEAIVQSRRYEEQPHFKRYSCNDGSTNIYTTHFELSCSSVLGFNVYFRLRDLREGFNRGEKEQVCAEGFYTDALLPYALDSQNSEPDGINRLSFFCAKLREELVKLHLMTDEIIDIFNEVEGNIDRVEEALEVRLSAVAGQNSDKDDKGTGEMENTKNKKIDFVSKELGAF